MSLNRTIKRAALANLAAVFFTVFTVGMLFVPAPREADANMYFEVGNEGTELSICGEIDLGFTTVKKCWKIWDGSPSTAPTPAPSK